MESRKNRPYQLLAYGLLLPAFLIYGAFVLVPSVQSLLYSFTDWEGLGDKTIVWFDNYAKIFSAKEWPYVWQALKNNLIWVLVSATVPPALGVILANMLVRGRHRGAKFYQLIFFLPQIISMVVASVAWNWIYNPLFGPLTQLGLAPKTGFLSSQSTVLPALLVIDVWMSYGFCCLIYTSALQNIDPMLYDAGIIDGTSPFSEFFYITLPCLRENTTTVVMMMVISAFKVFDLVYTMTNGGPSDSSNVISLYAYKEGFMYNRMGYASAVTMVITLILLVVSVLINRNGRERS